MRTKSARHPFRLTILGVGLSVFLGPCATGFAQNAPAPLLEKGKPPVDWWFVFKFNTQSFPLCGGHQDTRACIFGGSPQSYQNSFSQQFVYASKDRSSPQQGRGCIGDTTTDPVGATFDQVYNGSYHYVIWNDQFYNDPNLPACGGHTFCDNPWGHSKGMLAWNDDGDGFVMQVSTPNWPGAGNKHFPRQSNGNTLGCITHGTTPHDNVLLSQHFFSLKLTKADVLKVLKALRDASVVTKHNASANDRQIVNNGGPADIAQLVQELGTLSNVASFTRDTLSTGVQLIMKPSNLNVPPWQMVSAVLGRVPLRVATKWDTNKIPDTDEHTTIGCWNTALLGEPRAAVKNATEGQWNGKKFGLQGGSGADDNHAKIGVSVSGNFSIFGDMNQEGSLSGPDCTVHQNGRGGLFFVVEDQVLSAGLRGLLGGTGAN